MQSSLLHARSDVCLFQHSISLNLPSILCGYYDPVLLVISRVLERIGISKTAKSRSQNLYPCPFDSRDFAKKIGLTLTEVLPVFLISPLRLVPTRLLFSQKWLACGDRRRGPPVSVEEQALLMDRESDREHTGRKGFVCFPLDSSFKISLILFYFFKVKFSWLTI